LIPLELALSPVRIFAIGIKHALDVACHADPSEHRRAADRRDQDQRLHRGGLPLLELLVGLGQLLDVSGGVLEGDELTTPIRSLSPSNLWFLNPIHLFFDHLNTSNQVELFPSTILQFEPFDEGSVTRYAALRVRCGI
jgi:hypothetical protein